MASRQSPIQRRGSARGAPRRRPAPARRQVDQPPRADARATRRRASRRSAAPATAPTSARRLGSSRRLGRRGASASPATAGNVDYVVRSRGGRRSARARRRRSTAATPARACGSSPGSSQASRFGRSSMATPRFERRPMARIIEPLRRWAPRSRAATAIASSADRGRSQPAAGDRLVDTGSVGTGQVGDPARGPARGGRRRRSASRSRPATTRSACSGRGAWRSRLGARRGAAGRWSEIEGGASMQARDELVPGDTVRGRVLARRRRDPPRRRAAPARRRRQPDAPRRDRRPGAAWARRSSRRPSATPGPRARPIADLVVRSSGARGDRARAPAETAAAIDEIPILCLAATQARGRTVDPRRGRAAAQGIGPDRRDRRRAAGARRPDRGQWRRHRHRWPDDRCAATTVDSLGDHRLALTFAIAGLIADGRTPPSGTPRASRSRIPRSSPTSKGSDHDQAGRPHRPPRRPLAVRGHAAGRVRRAGHRRASTSCGTARPSRCPTRSRRSAATTSSA